MVVVDDHPKFRHGLRGLIDEAPDCAVVGEAPDGASAVRLVQERKPHVVLMDLHMPRVDGIDATADICELPDPPAVIVLTASSVSDDVLDALAAGAAGYLLKGASGDEIHAAIRAVRAGRSPLSPEITGAVLDAVRSRGEAAPRVEKLPSLTEREETILRLIGQGRENAEIADELFLSPATVKTNVSALFQKLGVKSRVQAAVLAVRAGLI